MDQAPELKQDIVDANNGDEKINNEPNDNVNQMEDDMVQEEHVSVLPNESEKLKHLNDEMKPNFDNEYLNMSQECQ